MANSQYEYVKSYESQDILLPQTYIVVRIDGRGFHRLSEKYGFERPNDRQALELMNAAAMAALRELPDITVAYGISDEFSKITTTVVSTFTSYYVHLWPSYFPEVPLSPPLPSFDGRAVLYPNEQVLRDYMSWRQVDCHINNLFNTTFWALVQKGGLSQAQAEERLRGTISSEKQEILFSQFGINYNNEPEMFKKGSVLFRKYDSATVEKMKKDGDDGRGPGPMSRSQKDKERKRKEKAQIAVEHRDIIKDTFWNDNDWIL